MTRFTELLATNEVHSAYEDVTTTTSVEDTAPASVEDPVNPQPLDFETMSKLDLETFGRTIGIELDSCLLYTSPSPRDVEESRMPSSA